MSLNIRSLGAIRFLGWSCVAAIGWLLVFWVVVRWHKMPIGASVPIVGLPGALALVGLAEFVTGLPARTIGSKLNGLQLAPWQQNIIWLFVFFIGMALMMAAIVLFA